MFMQGTPPSPPPPIAVRHRPRTRRLPRQTTPEAERLRLLLQLVDARAHTQQMLRNILEVTTAAAFHAVSILQQALYNTYLRLQCMLKSKTKEIITQIDAPNRFQRLMGGATSFLHYESSSVNEDKFAALESELQLLKEQMALLLQQGKSSPLPVAPSAPPCPAIPVPPPCPAPSAAVVLAPSVPISHSSLSFLDELICSDVSESEGDDDEEAELMTSRREGIPPRRPPLRPRNDSGRRASNGLSFSEQLQERNRVGLKKTRIDRSPGGTPLKRNHPAPGSDGFHKEILANALFRKFQNVRADESPERSRPNRSKAAAGKGLAALFEQGEVQEEEWDDKGNSH